jgi:mRNA-degrading endonuclease RelE of RelBE toxin-antitoxin system
VKPFRLLIDYEVLEFIARLSPKEQHLIRRQMLRVRDFPYNHADYPEKDEFGRQYHVHIFGKYALKYWIDEADRHLKIMEIRPSDRG